MTGVSLPISCLFCSRSGQRPPKRRPAFEPLVTDIKGESARGFRPQNMVAFYYTAKRSQEQAAFPSFCPLRGPAAKAALKAPQNGPPLPFFSPPPRPLPAARPCTGQFLCTFQEFFKKLLNCFCFCAIILVKYLKYFYILLCSARRQGACAVRPLFQKRAAWQRPPRGLLSAALRKEGIFCPAFCLTPCLSYSCSAWALRPISP